jgi:nicotinamide phosphoribosyltransferase
MKQTNPMLLIDFYKAVHAEMLPKGITKSVSYFTPRMSRVKRWNEVAMFGLQGFIKEYLVDYFNEYFFFEYRNKAIGTYKTVMDATLGEGTYGLQKIEDLYDLGYLPIEIKALPEGTLVPMHVPMFSIENTHKDFAWLPQALESLISAEMWHPMIAATVGHTYRQIVNKFYEMTCDDDIPKSKALGAFDFRGEECLQSVVKAGAGWCLSFLNTATVPTIPYLERNYNCDCTKEPVAFGSPSTEHAVMCSNYAIDGDEETLIKRLLTEIYPNTSFSAVLDSYDYWNVVENILPKLKNEIMNHNGCFLVRGDSGDCVDVVTRTVFKLWEEFGGTTNSKGYKVLDTHVKAIYGDSITVQRCEQIYDILEKNGFAASNVALGVGSFSFQCIEENGVLKPFTRDTFSSCIKATYCEIDGKPYPIFKNPKDGGFKKSQRGLCHVYTGSDGKLTFKDGYTSENLPLNNLLETVFRDGKLVKEQSLQEIRRVLNEGEF